MNYTLSRSGLWSRRAERYLMYLGRDDDKVWISVGRFTLMWSWDRK